HSGEPVTINNGATLGFTGTFTLAAARAVTLGSGGGTFDTNGSSPTIAGVISGSSLTKAGAGTLTLTNDNTYAGATKVQAGTLVLTKSLTTSASANVSSGATFGLAAGSGAVLRTSAVSIAGTGKIDLSDNKM